MIASVEATSKVDYDVIIVGAGFAGLYALYKLRKEGYSARVYETGTGVGGVWYWNRYPGARVDVENLEYSYTFSAELERDWQWSERYSSQPELEAYANHVADRFDLRRDIQFDTRVTAMRFDEERNRWHVDTNRGDEVTSRYCVMATGCLSIPKTIDLPGIDDFKGAIYRTSLWPKEGVDFSGKRVGEVGTGSSGVQSIPIIAAQAAHLTVFQRTATFSMPSQNGASDPARVKAWFDNRDSYHRQQRQSAFGLLMTEISPISAHEVSAEERRRLYEERWAQGGLGIIGTFYDLLIDQRANDTAAEFVREKIRALVDAPEMARKLITVRPSDLHQAAVCRQRLLRDLQPRQCHARRSARRAARDRDRDRHPRRRQGLRLRHPGAGNRFRRDDRRAVQHRHSRSRRRLAPGAMGRRSRDLSRPRRRRLPQYVSHHRPGQPFGARQHDLRDRGELQLDR